MKMIKKIISAVLVLTAIAVFAAPVFAEEIAPASDAVVTSETAAETETADSSAGSKAIAAAICVGIAAAAGAVGMAMAISKSNESIARQPEAVGNIRASLMLGLVFIETAIIYALIVAILIIFVL
jgi:F-type H+-transporting ATPase subunit c